MDASMYARKKLCYSGYCSRGTRVFQVGERFFASRDAVDTQYRFLFARDRIFFANVNITAVRSNTAALSPFVFFHVSA